MAASFNGPDDDLCNIPGPLGVKYDDRDESIDVILIVPGVKKPRFFGLFGGGNTTVDLKLEEQSLRIYLEVKKSKTKPADRCVFVVKRLPGKILSEDCTYYLRQNNVIITLMKEKKESWQNHLGDRGLETADE